MAYTITGVVYNSVTLGSGAYTAPLYIQPGGSITDQQLNTAGIVVPAAYVGAIVYSEGAVTGGAGGVYTGVALAGGQGVDFAGSGTLINFGSVTGGQGGFVGYANDVTGGVGGVGVQLSSKANLNNGGTITGGLGGFSNGGQGGAGGAGMVMAAGGYVLNTYLIEGGAGQGGYGGGNGGVGVLIEAGGPATLSNEGVILGGAGGTGDVYALSGTGGAGVELAAGVSLTLAGTVIGGTGGGFIDSGAGGAGVDVGAAATLLNYGSVTGGTGGYSSGYHGDNGGRGGAGINMAAGAVVGNAGTITGGSGGEVRYDYNGAGGVGVDLASGGHLVNNGTIDGGNAGQRGGPNAGGVGVYLSGGTLANAGTIAGGYNSGLTIQADSVQFGANAATLVVEAGAKFDGAIAGSAAVNDVLDLISGTGTIAASVTGIKTITDIRGANWTFTDELTVFGKASVTGQVTDAAGVVLDEGGKLRAGGSGSVLLGTATMAGGSIAVGYGSSKIAVGTTLHGAAAGVLTVETGASINGYGLITGTTGAGIVDDGTITADAGGTLSVGLNSTGTGTLAIDNESELFLHGTVTVANTLFDAGGGTLYLAVPKAFTSTISGFGYGDTIDVHGVKAHAIAFQAGTLSLLSGGHTGTVLDQLVFDGSYGTSSFAIGSDGHGGTDVTFVADARVPPDFVPALRGDAAPALAPEAAGGWHADPALHDPLAMAMLHHIAM